MSLWYPKKPKKQPPQNLPKPPAASVPSDYNWFSVFPTVTSAVSSFSTMGGGTPGMYYELDGSVKEVEDRGLAIEPIIGVREFFVFFEHLEVYLASYNSRTWPHRDPLHAHCGNDLFADHDAPKAECSCGIYAWNEKAAVGNCSGTVTGEVYLWGDVLISDLGYRAEMAYPKTLHIKAKPTRVVMRLRDGLEDAYGVPVTLTDPTPPVEEVEFDTTNLSGNNSIIAFGGLCPPSYPSTPDQLLPPPDLAGDDGVTWGEIGP